MAAEKLLAGQLVAVPTETVYGLGAVATDESAVVKIFSAKQRPKFDPLICHIHSTEQLGRYVQSVPSPLQEIIDRYMPGPVTVLLDKKDVISDLVTSGLPRVAIRIPQHEMTLELLRLVDRPVAAPSANPFGYISPTTAQHVIDQLGEQVSYVLDGGSCDVGVESTIVGMEDDQLVVYRKGGLPVEVLYDIDADLIIRESSSSHPAAPGMLQSHYAPRVGMSIIDDMDTTTIDWDRSGFIGFGEVGSLARYTINLSRSRDYTEAARRLFGAMRELDQQDIDHIYVQLLPEEDLGLAINDRLRRAAAR